MLRTRARAAAALATYILALVAQLALPLIAYAETTNTTTTTNPLEKAVSLTNQVADALQKIAYSIVIIAFFVGVIHWAMGKGPEWLTRALLAAFAIAAGLWAIGYFIGK